MVAPKIRRCALRLEHRRRQFVCNEVIRRNDKCLQAGLIINYLT
jgi:hypothetical protein